MSAVRISGFTFIRNGVSFGYPFEQSIRSMLPLVDELIINVGVGSDETLKQIEALAENEQKIRIMQNVWNDALREGGFILSQQTNLALARCKGEWAIYLQADEVLHEEDYDKIRNALAQADQDHNIDGILFQYVHFYGDYFIVTKNPSAYRREIRAIRLGRQIQSYKDAQGFRKRVSDERLEKLYVMECDARIFHYGWVREPEVMKEKTVAMDRLYHQTEGATGENYKYKRIFGLEKFKGTHPAVMLPRIEAKKWHIDLLRAPLVFTVKDIRKVLAWCIEKCTGWLPFEYKNYKRIARCKS